MKTYDFKTIADQWTPFSKLLKPITTEEEYENTRDLLNQLIDTVGNDDSHPLASLMQYVGSLIEDFEDQDEELNRIGSAGDAVSMLKFLMDQHNLKQVDLVDVFGSQGNVSAVLKYNREINLKHIKKLSKRFNVDATLFFK